MTGGAVRMGRAVGLALAAAGCDLFLHYGRSAERAVAIDDRDPHSMVGFQGRILQKMLPEAPVAGGCDMCHKGPRSFQIPCTHQWVCLGCWRENTRAAFNQTENPEPRDLEKEAVAYIPEPEAEMETVLTPDTGGDEEPS